MPWRRPGRSPASRPRRPRRPTALDRPLSRPSRTRTQPTHHPRDSTRRPSCRPRGVATADAPPTQVASQPATYGSAPPAAAPLVSDRPKERNALVPALAVVSFIAIAALAGLGFVLLRDDSQRHQRRRSRGDSRTPPPPPPRLVAELRATSRPPRPVPMAPRWQPPPWEATMTAPISRWPLAKRR